MSYTLTCQINGRKSISAATMTYDEAISLTLTSIDRLIDEQPTPNDT